MVYSRKGLTMKEKKQEIKFCPSCNKDVRIINKVFGVKLCTQCNRILASDIGIEKAGI